MKNLHRVFKADLSNQLQKDLLNLTRFFQSKKEAIEADSSLRTNSTFLLDYDYDVSDTRQQQIIEMDEEEEETEQSKLMEVKDGNLDLVVLLGFDQDIYQNCEKYKSDETTALLSSNDMSY